jgi:phytanoyl-CoA hydroxylase
MLTQEQRDQYQRDGYIVIPNFKAADELARLRARAQEIVDAFDPAESRAVFTTRDQENASDACSSARTTRCAASSKRKPSTRTAS